MARDITNRLHILDALRGLTVISMILYHFMWDVVYILGKDFPWYTGTLGYIWQQSICWSFILISGFSLGISRHPVRRGLFVSAIGVALMVVTNIWFPDLRIWFGVLTMIGASMVICGLLKQALIKIPIAVGIAIFEGLFFITRNINIGFLGFEGLNLMPLPESLYANHVTAFFGFPPWDFYSTDYFSLMPWIFLFLVGFYLYKLYSKGGDFLRSKKRIFLLSTIGRDSIFIYVIHQPIIYGIIYLITRNYI